MKLISPDLLRAFLKQRDMSTRRLARYAGCNPSFVSHLLTGRRKSCTPGLAERISEALQVPIEVLFMHEVSSNSPRIVTSGDAA